VLQVAALKSHVSHLSVTGLQLAYTGAVQVALHAVMVCTGISGFCWQVYVSQSQW
jgi:hypothetical protein